MRRSISMCVASLLVIAGCDNGTSSPGPDTGHAPDAFAADGGHTDGGRDAFVGADTGVDAFTALDGGADGAMDGGDDDAGSILDGGSDAFVGTDGGTDADLPDAATTPDGGGAIAGDTCATAPTLGVGVVTGTTVGATNDYDAGTDCSGTAGVDVVYAIAVAAGQTLALTVRNTGTQPDGSSFDPSISLVAGPAASCATTPRVCLAGDDSGSSDAVNGVVWTNTGAATTVYAVVDTYSDTSLGGPFALSVALLAAPTNDTCATAPSVGAGHYTGTTATEANDYHDGTDCEGTDGADVAYAIAVPAGQRVVATVQSIGGSFDPSINFVVGPAAMCSADPIVCVAGSDAGDSSEPDTAGWLNDTGSDATIFALVDSYSSTGTGPFTLDVTVGAPPAGDTCATATRVTTGSHDDTLIGYGNDFGDAADDSCDGTAGIDRAYVISVGSGQTLTASVVSDDFDPSISLQSGCSAARACIATEDGGGVGDTDTVMTTNGGAAAMDVIIVVDTYSTSSPGGAYTLDVMLTP